MMMNRLGMILVLTAIGVCTERKLSSLHMPMEELLLAEDMLRSIENEMKRSVPDMPTLFFALQGRCEGREREFYCLMHQELQNLGTRSFFQIWSDAAAAFFTALTKGELGELCRLGKSLCAPELDTQLAELAYCRKFLSQSAVALRTSYPQTCRLTIGLSAAVGVLAMILYG